MSRQTPGQLEWLLPGEQFTGILPRRKAWPANGEIVPREFVVPQSVLSTGPCHTTDPKTGLLSLPMELLVEIFRSGTNEDAICLALTCKALLFASTLAVKHRPTLPPSNRTSFHHFQTATRFDDTAHRSRETMIRFLLRLSPLGPGRRASPAVSLCQDCLRYRPVDPRWWTTDKGAPCPKQSAMMARAWEVVVEHWRWRRMLQCPECWASSHEAVEGFEAPDESSAWPAGRGALEGLINTRPLFGYDWP
ncbi:uncharacterized protein TRIREDRAFT_110731 [Trichoderma reesei QM6a]|uniref:Predicted protein n=2 Tax=Hypocrea jecorina TaxID=51453 RepID=G0RST0_HYPJQ|nr:uncharacterized protein TRIREDRAFT_110731 [Trichoderma reesei QM6a]EGR45734.1 predicted protein [Trichoderma reesei QM6a]ETR97339.1 hypothetical protein M419DRAFT_91860 [Trichoderma reesei RUT C-30]